MAFLAASDSSSVINTERSDESQRSTASPSPYLVKIYAGQDLPGSSVLGELRTVINDAYRSHDINLLGKIGERIQHNTQIVDEIGTNGFTVVMSCVDEIVGTASVKDWKPSA
ncbi:hypothetical protein LB503_010533 [Fusarium chuoi]|nr:hypothetical protein LB503_010533 [Fusarium chuoi]